jgi:F0F1-type ATP synthase delta subunit
MVMISFTSDSTRWKVSPKCTLSIKATIRYNKNRDTLFFYKSEKLESNEKERLKQRIEKTILSKLKYKYRKVNPW